MQHLVKLPTRIAQLRLYFFLPCLLLTCAGNALAAPKPTSKRPNVLFVILDDVGIDQMAVFGYGGENAPKTPNIDAIAKKGVRFRNAWGMPECSPSRAAFFTGRYPFRNNIKQAIGSLDLANSQVSPYEMTVPKVMKKAGYTNGLFGKFHLGGPDNNPGGHGTPGILGLDYFYGYIGGLPDSIDTTAGGVAPEGTYTCGFVNDASTGACYFVDGSCKGDLPPPVPGRACMERGGIFVPNTACSTPPVTLNFNIGNAYYASPVVINRGASSVTQFGYANQRSRVYRSNLEVDSASAWIKKRTNTRPWMATVSFSADHTPIQQPPVKLLSEGTNETTSSLNCANAEVQRLVSNQMIEAMDTEIGRLLVETGLARRDSNGKLRYDPNASNTMVVILGDNGSYGAVVKAPFDTSRAKGTSYQTGVWVPVIVAGPLVRSPNRDVEHMVNVVDVYQLFGEMAGLNVHKIVDRPIDSKSMLPYLRNPKQQSIRKNNFAMFGQNISENPYGNGPCVIATTQCSQTPISKAVCEVNDGVWWGPGATDPSTAGIPASGLQNCCEVNQFKYQNGQPTVFVLPATSALRDDHYKVVRNTSLDYDSSSNSCQTKNSDEFYEIDQAVPVPKLDTQDRALPLNALSAVQQSAYDTLSSKLTALMASQPACPGDGNSDGVVNREDLKGYEATLKRLAKNLDGDSNYSSSVFDFNYDGQTDATDKQTIVDNLGKRCY